jgi:hypothetical protein
VYCNATRALRFVVGTPSARAVWVGQAGTESDGSCVVVEAIAAHAVLCAVEDWIRREDWRLWMRSSSMRKHRCSHMC